MIIVEYEKPAEYCEEMVIRFSKPVYCPECKLEIGMWRNGYRKRKLKDFKGNPHQIQIPIYICQKCGKVFWTLPSFLLPYRQYDRYTIETVQKGCRDGCGASYLSIYFWKRIVL